MPGCRERYVPSGSAPPGYLPVLMRPSHAELRRSGEIERRRPPRVLVPEAVRSRISSIEYSAPAWVATPPQQLAALPEPWHYFKEGVKKLDNGLNDGKDRGMVLAVGGGVIIAMIWYPWLPSAVVALLWIIALAYGLSTVWLCHSGAQPWKWTTKRAAVATGLLWVLGWFLAGAFELVLLSLIMTQAFAYKPSAMTSATWYSEKRLIRNWGDAGLFGAKPPEDLWFRFLEQHHTDERGMETLTVVPMAGPRRNGRVLNVGSDQVEKARSALERVMGLKVGQLHVSHDMEHDAGAITMTVTPPLVKHAIAIAEMPQTWDYNEPLFIGNDHLGRPVHRRTWGCHSGFVAMTQKGKTASVLYDVGHAALDPRVIIYLLDFKGDDKDFSALLPLCKRSVIGASLESARKALSILTELEQLSESRTSLQPDDPGILVIVDEWFRLLSLAQRLEPELGKQLDSLLTELMATAASRRIKFELLFQGGTADYINKPMRINIGQRFCGVTESTAEVRYFLETMPAHLPKVSGQFIFKDDGVAPVLVTHPYLDPASFAEVCARAARLRGAAPAQPPVSDPLTVAVQELLAVQPMKPSELLVKLPAELQPPNAQALGYLLKKMAGVAQTSINGLRHYRLDPALDQVQGALSCTSDTLEVSP